MATSSSSTDAAVNVRGPPNFVSNCIILSSAFLQTPSSPPLSNKPTTPILTFGHLQQSLLSSANRFFTAVHSFAADNPLFQKLSAFSAHLATFRPINSRNYRSNSISAHNFAAVLPGDSVATIVVANGIMNFLNIYNTLLVVRLVLTWFPNSPPAIVSPLSTLCDPYLNIFRGIIPPLGGTLDLSPILAFLVLNAFTSTAAALPAELPVTGAHSLSLSEPQISNLTSPQKKWMRRVSGKWARKIGGAK